MNLYLQLFISFLQIGALSFGGGYAAMPLIQQQVVTLHGWLSLSEFTDLITISQMTPRPHRHQFRHLRGNQGRRVLGGPLCYHRLRPAFLPAGFPAGLGLFKIRSPLHNPGRTLLPAPGGDRHDRLGRFFHPDIHPLAPGTQFPGRSGPECKPSGISDFPGSPGPFDPSAHEPDPRHGAVRGCGGTLPAGPPAD